MNHYEVADLVCLNIGATERKEAMAIGFEISDRIIGYLVDNKLAGADLKRHGLGGVIWKEVQRIHALGVAEGRAIERSDNVCRALFGIE